MYNYILNLCRDVRAVFIKNKQILFCCVKVHRSRHCPAFGASAIIHMRERVSERGPGTCTDPHTRQVNSRTEQDHIPFRLCCPNRLHSRWAFLFLLPIRPAVQHSVGPPPAAMAARAACRRRLWASTGAHQSKAASRQLIWLTLLRYSISVKSLPSVSCHRPRFLSVRHHKISTSGSRG